MNSIMTLFQQQKKLIVIFILTIVLPTVAMSIFGIRAIMNEKYRREQKILDEQQNCMMLLRREFSNKLENMEAFLQKTTQLPAFRNQEYRAIRQYLKVSLRDDKPVDEIFILFGDGLSFFPLLQPEPDNLENSETILTSAQQTLQTQAWNAEFIVHDYKLAISLLEELFIKVKRDHTRAQVLNHLARVQKKAGMIGSAIHTYKRIIDQYFSSLTSAGLPLALTAGMQIVDCERISGHQNKALNGALTVYERILEGEWVLTETRFLTYAEMARETIEELLDEMPAVNNHEEQHRQYISLQEVHNLRVEQWKVRRQIETEIIPVLKEITNQSKPEPFNLSRTVQGKDYLITAVPASSMLCIKWNNDQMIREWLQPIVDKLPMDEQNNIIITDLTGKILLGNADHKHDSISLTGEFDNYFPPWKIRMVRSVSNTEFGIDLFNSYYFWSIITLLIILIFGTLMIIRTIVREREVMTMKSNFVSSVSHELKTPLTSIRALTERLLAGKIKSPEKMHQYFSVIDQDANRLTRMVKNILDFSKIEAGKKVYSFEVTDVTDWLDETVDDFIKDHIHERIEIRKHFDPDIPSVAIDKDAFSRCLNNLLDNAIKFSPKSKSVGIYLQKKSEFIIIRVEDQGIGIPKEDLDRIFDRFFQSRSSNQLSEKGTGLGLALVKHTIEAHGGRISVKSSPGQGSIFTIFLPLTNIN